MVVDPADREDGRIIPSQKRCRISYHIDSTRLLGSHVGTTRNNPELGIMTKVMQARAGLARPPAQVELSREPDEGAGQMIRADGPAAGEHEEMVAGTTTAQADFQIAGQCRPGRLMQGHEPRLAGLRVADLQPVRREILQLQSDGFRTPQAGRREQAEQVMERSRA